MNLNALRFDVTPGIRTIPDKISRIIGWFDCGMRVSLTAVFSISAYLVFAHATADHYSRQQTQKGIRRAIHWEPWNSVHYADLARGLERPLKEGDLPAVIRLYEKAVQLNPRDAGYWVRLGQAYEWAGRTEEAKIATEQARNLAPMSPAMNWTIGNFYLRQGETERALGAFQKTILAEPEMRRPAFDLAWRATGNGQLIAQTMIPAQTDIYFEYLDYLLAAKQLDEAEKIWARIVDSNIHYEPAKAFSYLDALIQQGRIGQLAAAWSALESMTSFSKRGGTSDGNLVTNGDFQAEILNGGLDWRINPASGATVDIDNSDSRGGVASLRIRFDGKQNLSDELIFQYVPVVPDTSYHFAAFMRAYGITTDSGPRFQIRDAAAPDKFFLQSSDMVGTSSWLLRKIDFKAGPETSLLEIRVTRLASAKLDNRIAGTAWVKGVQLTAIESASDSNRLHQSTRSKAMLPSSVVLQVEPAP